MTIDTNLHPSLWDTSARESRAEKPVFQLDFDVQIDGTNWARITGQDHPHWATALTNENNDTIMLQVFSKELVISLNGAKFKPVELDFLRNLDWSWDLDAMSEGGDLHPNEMEPFSELTTKAKDILGEEAGQDFVERLMRMTISFQDLDGNASTFDFGDGLFHFSIETGAFFADPSRTDALIDIFARTVSTQ